MKTERNALPVSTPPIVSFLHHAYPLSVTFTREETLPWFYSNYVQLFCYFKDDNFKMNFFSTQGIYPWILTTVLNNNLFSKVIKKDIIQFLIDCIDNNIYAYLFLDEYYVPERQAFGQTHLKHDTFVFGYDLNEGSFEIAGFTNYLYNISRVDFDSLKTAFLHPGQPDDIFLYQWKNTVYEFDRELVRNFIHDYLYAENTFKQIRIIASPAKNNHLIWGLKTYDGLMRYVNMLSQKKVKRDVIPFHVLYEHKKCMRMRIEYMIKNGYLSNIDEISDFYLAFEEKTLVLRNLALKSLLVDTEIAYRKLQDQLYLIIRDVVPKEEEVLKLLLSKLF